MFPSSRETFSHASRIPEGLGNAVLSRIFVPLCAGKKGERNLGGRSVLVGVACSVTLPGTARIDATITPRAYRSNGPLCPSPPSPPTPFPVPLSVLAPDGRRPTLAPTTASRTIVRTAPAPSWHETIRARRVSTARYPDLQAATCRWHYIPLLDTCARTILRPWTKRELVITSGWIAKESALPLSFVFFSFLSFFLSLYRSLSL